MKNVQVIDDANNCTFSIFQATDEAFDSLFPDDGQDIEFAEDIFLRLGEEAARAALEPMWGRPVVKSEANGIHGTLFYGFEDRKHCFPISRRECDWNEDAINHAQRLLYATLKKKPRD